VPAYMIFLRDEAVHDPAEFAEYQRLNRENRDPSSPMEPLVVYGDIEALEGEAPDGIVMLKFPTVEDARAWYDRPAYQEALQHRLRAADYRAMIVQGL
jgi:uncharacterized protein (DUF1330 family)